MKSSLLEKERGGNNILWSQGVAFTPMHVWTGITAQWTEITRTPLPCDGGRPARPPLVLPELPCLLTLWPQLEGHGVASLLRAADFLLESSRGWKCPRSWSLCCRLSFVGLCVFQALQFSKTLISSWLICIQSNAKSELWVLESRPLSQGSRPLVAGPPVRSILLMIHRDGDAEGQG